MVLGCGFTLGFRGLGFSVWRFRVSNLGFRVWRFRAEGLGVRVGILCLQAQTKANKHAVVGLDIGSLNHPVRF